MDRLRVPLLAVGLWAALACALGPAAADDAFTNALARADAAEKRSDIRTALAIYAAVQKAEAGQSPQLCLLARKYCDLTYLTHSVALQKDLTDRALACSLQALAADSNNATAHASVAVCYAKECEFADIKGELNYSRLFKQEAERAIALDPRQDIAYYLLGRWNYGVANVGFFSRALVKVIYGGLPKASNGDAIADFKKAIELAPNRIIYHSALAAVYQATGEKSEEISELKKCRDLRPAGREDEDAQRDAVKRLAELAAH